VYKKALIIIFGPESSSRVVWLTSSYSSAGLCRRVFQLSGCGWGSLPPIRSLQQTTRLLYPRTPNRAIGCHTRIAKSRKYHTVKTRIVGLWSRLKPPDLSTRLRHIVITLTKTLLKSLHEPAAWGVRSSLHIA